jgi:hypothetical protein
MINAVRAELSKLASLRLATLTAASIVALTAGLSWGLTALTTQAFRDGRAGDAGGLEPGTAFLPILHYGQVGGILLGAWVLFQEADNGVLRSSFLAIPRRATLFWAKLLTTLAATTAVGLVAIPLGYLGRCVAGGCSAERLSTTGTPDAVVLAGYVGYWALISVLTFVVSAAVRNGLVGMGIMLALVLAVSQYLLRISDLARFLPDQAGAQLYQLSLAPGQLDAGQGLLVLLAWVVAGSCAGLASFRTWEAGQ